MVLVKYLTLVDHYLFFLPLSLSLLLFFLLVLCVHISALISGLSCALYLFSFFPVVFTSLFLGSLRRRRL